MSFTNASTVPAPLIPGDFNASDGYLSGDLVTKGNVWLGTDLTTTVTILGNLDIAGDIELDDVIANSVSFTGSTPVDGDITGFANVIGDGSGGISGFATGSFTGLLSGTTAAFTGSVGIFGATPPAVQGTTANLTGGATAIGVGTTANLDSTYGGYTVAQVVEALQNHGLLA